MDIRRLQAWWSHRQGLNAPDPSLTSAQVLEKAGWARSVGGVNPYLTLFSRARISQAQAERDLANQDIHELPCARGCTYVVPASDYALALKVGQGFSDESAMKTARNFLGVTDNEVHLLMDKVEAALGNGPLDPKDLKTHVGEFVRNLGDEGKKRGQTTTLPLALGFLQSQGRIRRIPANGRLDTQRYLYAAWNPSPLADFSLSKEEAFGELARRFFTWSGPAKPEHFQWFSGLGVKATKEALALAPLVAVEDGWLILEQDRDAFEAFQIPAEPAYSLVGGIDSHLMARRDLPNLILPEDMERKQATEKGFIAMVGSLQDMANHPILDRGRLVGLWEYDPAAKEIVWSSFIPPDDLLRKAISEMETFIQDELGDVRSFSLDSPESRKPKIDALRNLA